jgi:hypothetical protein
MEGVTEAGIRAVVSGIGNNIGIFLFGLLSGWQWCIDKVLEEDVGSRWRESPKPGLGL